MLVSAAEEIKKAAGLYIGSSQRVMALNDRKQKGMNSLIKIMNALQSQSSNITELGKINQNNPCFGIEF
jgi:hypothetical protein